MNPGEQTRISNGDRNRDTGDSAGEGGIGVVRGTVNALLLAIPVWALFALAVYYWNLP